MPVCFPNATQTFDGATGYTVGWGAPVAGKAWLVLAVEVLIAIVDFRWQSIAILE
jgi:hypothetical protein